MNNDSERISASEVNRFCFCEYSWYYERLYGRKYIVDKYKNKKQPKKQAKKKKSVQETDDAFNNFKRGLEFHDSFILKRRINAVNSLMIVFIVLSIIIAIALVLKLCG